MGTTTTSRYLRQALNLSRHWRRPLERAVQPVAGMRLTERRCRSSPIGPAHRSPSICPARGMTPEPPAKTAFLKLWPPSRSICRPKLLSRCSHPSRRLRQDRDTHLFTYRALPQVKAVDDQRVRGDLKSWRLLRKIRSSSAHAKLLVKAVKVMVLSS
jgi:hypothetical protein